jgi:hypothetical protein
MEFCAPRLMTIYEDLKYGSRKIPFPSPNGKYIYLEGLTTRIFINYFLLQIE